ncbi:MAG: hypothetical protein IH914_09280 [candidate division Zixibacteria bacterium]|nr:hypothetical protein [candidate division Zixibacteria bacterium]
MNTLNQLQPRARSPLTAFSVFASLSLLAVFTVGCSEQRLSALSSDDASTLSEAPTLTESEQTQFDAPLLAKPGGSSEATFSVTISGDISGGPETRTQSPFKPSSTQVVISKPGIALDLAYFQTALTGGGTCFGSGEFTGPLAIQTKKKNTPSLAVSQFFFNATGSDVGGTTEIKYVITMNGTFTDPNNWPPAVGTQNTAMMTKWEMKTEGAGKDKKISCTGKGTFSSGVTILIERIS